MCLIRAGGAKLQESGAPGPELRTPEIRVVNACVSVFGHMTALPYKKCGGGGFS